MAELALNDGLGEKGEGKWAAPIIIALLLHLKRRNNKV